MGEAGTGTKISARPDFAQSDQCAFLRGNGVSCAARDLGLRGTGAVMRPHRLHLIDGLIHSHELVRSSFSIYIRFLHSEQFLIISIFLISCKLLQVFDD